MKVLKVFEYRGSRIYIRSVKDRLYEVLVVFRGQIYCHQLQTLKELKFEKRRASLAERDNGAIGELMDCGQTMVDSFLLEFTFRKVATENIKNLIKKIHNIYGKIIARSRVRQAASIEGSGRESARVQEVQQEQG